MNAFSGAARQVAQRPPSLYLHSPHSSRDTQASSPLPTIDAHSIEQSSGQHSRRSLWTYLSDTWLPEVFAAIICMMCSLAIGIMLFALSGKPSPSLPEGFTLNAIISILATTSKSSMLLVIATCLAQMRWIWFREARCLTDLQVLSDATQGPFGSLVLLWSPLARSIAIIGALITIFALTYDPFVQLAVVYPLVQTSTQSTQALARQSLGFFVLQDDDAMSEAVNAGIWSQVSLPDALCASTNCTWEPIRSVGWCHKCQTVQAAWTAGCGAMFTLDDFEGLDRFQVMTRTCEFVIDNVGTFSYQFNTSWDYEQPANTSWSVYYESPGTISWVIYDNGLPYPSSDDLEWPGNKTTILGVENPMLALGYTDIISSQDNTSYVLNNTQVCTLDFCQHTYNVSAINGISKVEILKQSYGTKFRKISTNSNNSSLTDLSYCWSAGRTQGLQWETKALETGIGIEDSNLVEYDASELAFCDLVDQGCELADPNRCLNSFRTGDFGEQISAAIIGNLTLNSEAMSSHNARYCALEELCGTSLATANDERGIDTAISSRQVRRIGFSNAIGRLATSLTKASLASSWTNIEGESVSLVPHVEVRWHWLALPALLNVLAAVFLALTFRATKKSHAPLWKTSVTALLFHGFEKGEDFSSVTSVSDMDVQAGQVRVRLRGSEKHDNLLFGA